MMLCRCLVCVPRCYLVSEYLAAGARASLAAVVVSDTPRLVVLLQERAEASSIEVVVF